MRSKRLDSLLDSEGKGVLGCLTFIFLFGAAVFLGAKLVPIYYTNYNFESDLKAEVSRIGARFVENDMVVRNIMDLARRNEIKLKKENIRIERFAGQIHINVEYTVPVDFIIWERKLNFQIKVSSFTVAG